MLLRAPGVCSFSLTHVVGGRCIPQFTFSIIDGYWGDFQLWIVMDTAALNIS